MKKKTNVMNIFSIRCEEVKAQSDLLSDTELMILTQHMPCQISFTYHLLPAHEIDWGCNDLIREAECRLELYFGINHIIVYRVFPTRI